MLYRILRICGKYDSNNLEISLFQVQTVENIANQSKGPILLSMSEKPPQITGTMLKNKSLK